MLSDSELIAFITVTRAPESRRFYESTLGLDFVREEPGALMFRCRGRLLRVQIVDELGPPKGTVLGWEVEDIAGTVSRLAEAGLSCERYPGMPQDERGIATFPNGDRVAWFLDPDENILSITQFTEQAT